ncbi:Myosin type-2 heavy chain 1 [Friedmanniomyces endolithicus]|nr:Myosin type-2 heavy chain 1 [Friedmanniomyces endolithicus]
MQPFVKALTVDLASIRAFQLVKQLVDGWALPSEDVLRTVGATQSVGLRQQLAEMQDQLEHAKRAQAVPVGMKGGGDMMNGNGGSTALSQASAGLINLTERYSGTFNPRPVSMAFGATTAGEHAQTLSGSTFNPSLENVGM